MEDGVTEGEEKTNEDSVMAEEGQMKDKEEELVEDREMVVDGELEADGAPEEGRGLEDRGEDQRMWNGG